MAQIREELAKVEAPPGGSKAESRKACGHGTNLYTLPAC